tara:strand:+ start:1567 stop:2097 length:531 start_codon:yes stop_codon:yes gene_type:complete
MEDSIKPNETSSPEKEYHKLHDSWTLWAHLPHDTDWSVKSYKKIMTFSTVEAALVLNETLPDKMIKNCMLFLMREGIKPMWEDDKNRAGGCFSYKVNNKIITTTWKQASYALIGESFASDSSLCASINGITISPKKNFCIIKIWLACCDYQNPQDIREVSGILPQGCLFKKHTPEY